MKNKLFLFSALIVSTFLFSACTLKDKAELEMLNKGNNKVDQKIEEINQETGDDTEEDLLKELSLDKDDNLNSEFDQLTTDLNQE